MFSLQPWEPFKKRYSYPASNSLYILTDSQRKLILFSDPWLLTLLLASQLELGLLINISIMEDFQGVLLVLLSLLSVPVKCLAKQRYFHLVFYNKYFLNLFYNYLSNSKGWVIKHVTLFIIHINIKKEKIDYENYYHQLTGQKHISSIN